MPIKRKVFAIGDSKAITLPKSWIEIYERQIGKPLSEVAVEVDAVLTIIPLVNGVPLKIELGNQLKQLIEESAKKEGGE